jgi:uncharacterized LabA/DUF88 family protein
MQAASHRVAVLVDGANAKQSYRACGGREDELLQAINDCLPDAVAAYYTTLGKNVKVTIVNRIYFDATSGNMEKDRGWALKYLFDAPTFYQKQVRRYAKVEGDSGPEKLVTFKMQAGVDVGLAVTTMDLVTTPQSPVTDVVLVSGDGDFHPLAQCIRGRGHPFFVVSTTDMVSRQLMASVADRYLPMDKVLAKSLTKTTYTNPITINDDIKEEVKEAAAKPKPAPASFLAIQNEEKNAMDPMPKTKHINPSKIKSKASFATVVAKEPAKAASATTLPFIPKAAAIPAVADKERKEYYNIPHCRPQMCRYNSKCKLYTCHFTHDTTRRPLCKTKYCDDDECYALRLHPKEDE